MLVPRGDYYKCSENGCEQDFLCIGCTYQCDGCTEDFCREHIHDVERDGEVIKRLCARCYQKHVAQMGLRNRVVVSTK